MSHPHRLYIPAAGHDFLLPFYDPLNRLLGVGALHEELIVQARLEPGHRVLDVGCGTGSLAVRICGKHPQVEVVGLDPDAKALAIARRKAERVGVAVRFEQGYGDALPFGDAEFDRVTSSLMLHHLDLPARRGMLCELFRVLRPGGTLHLLGATSGRTGSSRACSRAPRIYARTVIRAWRRCSPRPVSRR